MISSPSFSPEHYDQEKTAFRLAGQPWHSLSSKDTALAIHLERVTGQLNPAVRTVPEQGYGECLVGPVTISA